MAGFKSRELTHTFKSEESAKDFARECIKSNILSVQEGRRVKTSCCDWETVRVVNRLAVETYLSFYCN